MRSWLLFMMVWVKLHDASIPNGWSHFCMRQTVVNKFSKTKVEEIKDRELSLLKCISAGSAWSYALSWIVKPLMHIRWCWFKHVWACNQSSADFFRKKNTLFARWQIYTTKLGIVETFLLKWSAFAAYSQWSQYWSHDVHDKVHVIEMVDV